MPVRPLVVLLLAVTAGVLLWPGPAESGQRRRRATPPTFVENLGQWDTAARFVARTRGLTTRAEPGALVLDLAGERENALVRLGFMNCRPQATLAGEDRHPGLRNYFVGDDRSRWVTGARGFGTVRYGSLYAGIDLRLHAGKDGGLEYDLELAPFADLSACVVRCEGVHGLRLETDGTLVLDTAAGPLRQPAPTSWEADAHGARSPLACRYVLLGTDRFGFSAPARRHALAAVIDPMLVFSTYLGAANDEYAYGLGLDASGAPVVCGFTSSSTFPTTPGAYSRVFAGGVHDAFVTKLSAQGNSLVWSTLLGGNGSDIANALALDASGNVTLVGHTLSSNFPTTAGAWDTTFAGTTDAFAARLSAAGNSLLWSTFLGGSADESAYGIALEANGSTTVVGITGSSDYPTTPGAYATAFGGGGYDVFVTRLTPQGTGLVWSTFLGGSDVDLASGVALDASGAATVVGRTYSANFPTTPSAWDTSANGTADAFVTRISAQGNTLVYSTFLGGNALDEAVAVAVDAGGAAVVVGHTASGNFPTTAGAYDRTFGGSLDAFVAQLTAQGNGLVYASYLGGNGWPTQVSAAVLRAGQVTLTGWTSAADFPTTANAYDRVHNGGRDAFVARLQSGSTLLYSTFLGAAGGEIGTGVAVANNGLITVAGNTDSTAFPITAGAYSGTYGGGPGDVFVSRLAATPSASVPFGTGCPLPSTSGPLAFALAAGTAPIGGSHTVTMTVSPATYSGQAWILIGVDNGPPFPIDMAFAGWPGCTLYQAPLLAFPVAFSGSGGSSTPLSFPIPNDQPLYGATFFEQGVVVAGTALGATAQAQVTFGY